MRAAASRINSRSRSAWASETAFLPTPTVPNSRLPPAWRSPRSAASSRWRRMRLDDFSTSASAMAALM
jgi:hypothetical protein